MSQRVGTAGAGRSYCCPATTIPSSRTPSSIRTIPSGSCCPTGFTWSIRTGSSLPLRRTPCCLPRRADRWPAPKTSRCRFRAVRKAMRASASGWCTDRRSTWRDTRPASLSRATRRQQRGLDYLAVGDTHGFRVITESGVAPIVYPGAPEQTRFGESGAGQVALVTLLALWSAADRRRRSRSGDGRGATRSVTSLESLRRLASEDLSTTVLRLRLDMTRIGSGREGGGPTDAAAEGRRRQLGPRRRVRSRSERPACRSRQMSTT